jgi:Protein of unknown function (DUF1444)
MGLLRRLFGPPSREKFALRFAAALREADDNRKSVFHPEDFHLSLLDQDSNVVHSISLGNFYLEHCALPWSRRKYQLRHLASTLLSQFDELPTDFSEASANLRPLVRSRSYLESIRVQRQIQNAEPHDIIPYQEIGDHLVALVGYDRPDSLATVNSERLEMWGVSFYEAMETARHNLEAAKGMLATIGEGFYASTMRDGYDASRVLMLDLIRKLTVSGDIIAMVPNRDSLFITGSDDLAGLGLMADLADKAIDEPRPMNAISLRLDGNEWIPWMPERSHPLFQKFKMLEVKTMRGEYSEQKAVLEQLHSKAENSDFIATYSAIPKKDSEDVSSFCVWTAGVHALLPVVDRIAFVRDGKVVADTPWHRVLEVVGHMMEPCEMYPPRFRVNDFPTDAQLRSLMTM